MYVRIYVRTYIEMYGVSGFVLGKRELSHVDHAVSHFATRLSGVLDAGQGRCQTGVGGLEEAETGAQEEEPRKGQHLSTGPYQRYDMYVCIHACMCDSHM